MNRCLLFIVIALGFAASNWSAERARAQSPRATVKNPVLLDNMEGATPALRLVEPASGIQIVEQAMQQGGATDRTAERIVLAVPPGLSGHLAYNLPAAHVIDDFQLGVWVKCNRPGTRLAATVVLPHSIDPTTGEARRILVRSDKLAGVGGWELVTLDNLFVAVARQSRVLRAQRVGEIDERGAQVVQLVIMAPGGEGLTELYVDQIAMYGVLVQPGSSAAKAPLFAGPADGPAAKPENDQATPTHAAAPANPIAAPKCPRIVQWQGEPFALLKQIGFDGVWMARVPNPDELAEARRLGMAVVCPPPGEALAANRIDGVFDPVIAWDLGELADADELALAQSQAQRLLRCEGNAGRPTLARPRGMTRAASGVADMLMVQRPMAGSNVSWPWYAIWLGQQRRCVRPGTPLWVGVETHYGPGRRAQLAALREDASSVVPVTLAHLSQATTAALTTQPGAFVFQSQASLAAPDEASRIRRLSLELTNLRLGLMQPWLAESKSAVAARSNRDDLSAMVMKFERSHLIVPLRWSEDASFPATTSAPSVAGVPPTTVFVLPGVPESTDAYLLSSAGYDRLRTRRVTGGLEVSVDSLPDDGMVLLTEDGFAFSHIERYLREHGPLAARARVELAALRRQQAARAISQLPAEVERAIAARAMLSQVDSLLATVVETMEDRQFAAAFARAAQSERLLGELEARVWATIGGGLQAAAHPLPPHWSTVADGLRVASAMASGGPSKGAPSGDFENIDDFVATWERYVAAEDQASDPAATTIRLSPEVPQQGAYCLELAASPETEGKLPTVASGPRAWVTSPPIAVPPGCLLEVTGWARVPEPLGSVDPLLVFDSIGGEESALRFDAAPSWTPFRFVRAVPPGTRCRLTIALGAAGRAQVDSLQYRFIELTPTVQQVARQASDVR